MADILGPLVGQTDSFVKNSQHIASELIILELEEDDILVSHDFVSLFTNTPVKESLDTRLEQVSDWQDTMMLEKDDILELLEFVLTTTYFAFRDLSPKVWNSDGKFPL